MNDEFLFLLKIYVAYIFNADMSWSDILFIAVLDTTSQVYFSNYVNEVFVRIKNDYII